MKNTDKKPNDSNKEKEARVQHIGKQEPLWLFLFLLRILWEFIFPTTKQWAALASAHSDKNTFFFTLGLIKKNKAKYSTILERMYVYQTETKLDTPYKNAASTVA